METTKKTERFNRKLKKAKAFLALVKEKGETYLNTEMETMKGVKDHISSSGNFYSDIENKATEDQTSSDPQNEEERKKLFKQTCDETKKIIRERQKLSMQRPKLFLTLDEICPYKPAEGEEESIRPPLYAEDLQHLLLYALQGNVSSFKPRWCKLLRVTKVSSVLAIFMEGVSYSDFTNNPDSFPFLSQSFESHTEIVCPEQYGSTVFDEILPVPLSLSQIKCANKNVHQDIRREVANKIKPKQRPQVPSSLKEQVQPKPVDKFSRVCLLLSSQQMKAEGYPMPVKTKLNQYQDFVFSKDAYSKVTPDSPMYGVDCEMCYTTIHRNELTRVSIVGENGETVYDSLVKPKNRILNYLTKYSGITKKMLDPVTVTIEDVQKKIQELIPPDAILVGQSLNNDLVALKMFHPYVIDTSVVYNTTGQRRNKSGLKKLTGFFLNRTIQASADGHCSAEDAKAALDLVKLKLRKGFEFGDATVNGIYLPSVESYFLSNGSDSIGADANGTETEASSTEVTGKESAAGNDAEDKADDDEDKADDDEDKADDDEDKADDDEDKADNDEDEADDDEDEADDDEDKADIDEDEADDETVKEEDKVSNQSVLPNPLKRKLKANTATRDKEVASPLAKKLKIPDRKMQIFNQSNSTHVNRSIFKLVDEAGRTGKVIGRQELTDRCFQEPVETCTVNTDKEACKKAEAEVQTKELTWVNFERFRSALDDPETSEEKLEELKRKLDHLVEKLVINAKACCVVMAVMTGRKSDEDVHNAGVFLKVV